MSKESLFWLWFASNEAQYYHFEKNQNLLFDELKRKLNLIHPDLVFEFSKILSDGRREFVISADGIQSVFPVVLKLVHEAPSIKRWKFIAFRQPRKNITHIKYQSLVVNVRDVFFRYGKDSGKIALELNIKNFHESPEWTGAVFVLLDNILGEFDAEIFLSRIEKKKLDIKEVHNLLPIEALPIVLEEYKMEQAN